MPSKRRTLSLLALLLALLPLPTFAQTVVANPAEKTLSIDVADGDLHAVLTQVERQTGIVAVVRDGPTPYHPINIHIEDHSLAQTLVIVALSAGAKLTRISDGSYLFEPLDTSPPAPSTLTTGPHQVQIKVEFVPASIADVDNLGINFDLTPCTLPDGRKTFLQYATGSLVAQLYQTLIRTRGQVIQAPIITTTDNVPASIEVDTQLPGLNPQANSLSLHAGLTFIPRINSDDSVTLQINLPIPDSNNQNANNAVPAVQSHVTLIRTLRSGDTVLIVGPQEADPAIFGTIFRSRNKAVNNQELLIFLTPTIVGESADHTIINANGGQSVKVTP